MPKRAKKKKKGKKKAAEEQANPLAEDSPAADSEPEEEPEVESEEAGSSTPMFDLEKQMGIALDYAEKLAREDPERFDMIVSLMLGWKNAGCFKISAQKARATSPL